MTVSSGKEVLGFAIQHRETGEVKYWIHPWANSSNHDIDMKIDTYLENYEDYYFLESIHSHYSLNQRLFEGPSKEDLKTAQEFNRAFPEFKSIIMGWENIYVIDSRKTYLMKYIFLGFDNVIAFPVIEPEMSLEEFMRR